MQIKRIPYEEAAREWAQAVQQAENAEREAIRARNDERLALANFLNAIHSDQEAPQ
jgi:hypothetical protein